jgi:hypothetical protein
MSQVIKTRGLSSSVLETRRTDSRCYHRRNPGLPIGDRDNHLMKYVPYILFTLWCLIGVTTRVLPVNTVLTSHVANVDFPLLPTGAYALAQGLKIHKDFHTPMGVTAYLPDYWVIKWFGDSDRVPREAGALIFLFFSLVSFLILRLSRYDWWIVGMGTALITLVAANPVCMGDPPSLIYEAISYNPIGVAWCMLCLLAALNSGRADIAELATGGLCGIGLAWIVFLKPMFMMEGALLIVLGCGVYYGLTGKIRWRFIGSAAAAMLAGLLVIVMVYRPDLAGMSQDLKMAAQCRWDFEFNILPVSDTKGQVYYQGLTAMYFFSLRKS